MFLVSSEKIIRMPQVMNMSQKNFPFLLEKLEEIYHNEHKKLIIDLREVKLLSPQAFMVILAQLEKGEYKKNYGSILRINPRNKELLSMINGASSNNYHHHHQCLDVKNLQQDISVKSNSTKAEIAYAIENDLTKIRIYNFYELNTLIMELQENALEHGIKHKDINWWLYHQYDQKRKLVKIAFVDMGCGIITSYKESGIIPKSKPEEEIIIDALNGSLGSTTKEDNRGRGLPQIYTMVNNKLISDFIMITNNVSVRYLDNKLVVQKHNNFVGTYYSFSVNISNFNNYNIWKKGLISRKTLV